MFPFLAWGRRLDAETLRVDFVAGVLSALLVLPQAVAFATLAGLPAQMGLYAAMLPAIVGALWGSSWHLVSGPTNATSLMVYAALSAIAIPFSEDYIRLALTLNFLIGLIKLGLGIARLGQLANFVSQTVIVGFTAGAGLLIIAAQLGNFLGIHAQGTASFVDAVYGAATRLDQAQLVAVTVGIVTIVTALLARRLNPRLPNLLIGLAVGTLVGWWLNRTGTSAIATVGVLPSAIPPPSVPDFHAATWRTLAPAALALTLIGLTEAISSGRAVALRSGQRIDANQEFIGQGLANIAGAFTSSYPSSGSFNRTGANYQAGARTPLAAVFSAFVLIAVLFFVAPLAAYIPVAAMAALLFLVAAGLVDVQAMRRILRTSRGESLVLAITFVATLAVQLEFAIFVGVIASLMVYLYRTTRPRLIRVWPDPTARGTPLVAVDAAARYPSDTVLFLRVDGSLFFGAVDHVRDALHAYRADMPALRQIVLIGTGINFVDVAGADMLVQEARACSAAGIALYLCNLKAAPRDVLERGGFVDAFGRERVLDSELDALPEMGSGAFFAAEGSGEPRTPEKYT